MASLLSDLSYSARVLRRNPGFTAGAVIVLGLGVGAGSAMFTVARSLVFRPLPFHDPGRLVAVWKERVQTGARQGASWPDLADWKNQSQIFEGVAAYMQSETYSTSTDPVDDAARVSDIRVTGGFFPVLGATPILGRLFLADELRPMVEDEAPAPEPVIVSHSFWQRRLGGRTDVLGRAVKVEAGQRIVIGVLPRDFRIFRNDRVEVFSPLRAFPGHQSDRRMGYLEVIGRLRPGISLHQGDAEMRAYGRRAAREHAETESGLAYRLEGLHEHWFGSRRPLMILLLGTVGLVLLTGCANVAVLLAVRASGREREVAIRAALGASRAGLARQSLIESLLLGIASGAFGLLLSLWATDLLTAFSATAGLKLPALRMDLVAVFFALALSAAASMLFGLLPSIHFSKPDLSARLKAGSPGSSTGFSAHRLSSVMVVAEIALSTVLLAGAGLLAESFVRMSRADRGFQADRVLTMSIGRAPLAPGFRRREYQFWTQLIERAQALPNVDAAAVCGSFPLADRNTPKNMVVEISTDSRHLPAPGFVDAEFQDVSPGYFLALGIPVIKGRSFEWRDANSAGVPVVINESFAREIRGNGEPLGRRLLTGKSAYTVVGVAADVKQYELRRGPAKRLLYRPLWDTGISKWPSQYLVVRTSQDPRRMAGMLRGVVRSLNPERPVVQVRTLNEVVYGSTAWDRLTVSVTGLFGLAALLLAVVGVYAVVSQAVLQRRREIGIRVALGGRPADIRGMVLRKGAALALGGVALGVTIARLLARFLERQLYDVSATDPTMAAAVSLILFGAALAACYLPARMATRVDPISVLRAE